MGRAGARLEEPTPFGTADAAKAAFILRHDQNWALIFDWPRCDCRVATAVQIFFPWGEKRSRSGSDRMKGRVRSSSGKETDDETPPKLSPGEAALVSASRA